MTNIISTGRRVTAASISALLLFSGAAMADQVFADDVIIQGSLCVGFDCVNNESFGSDTIRLKENNLRIHFEDTSAAAGFPTNDWRIVANDQNSGGASYLAFEDASAGRQPFRVEASARANALYVEGDGDIGIGTSNPVVDLHVVTGNTPTLRLDQDGSSGFAPQVWDLAGNETNFFIRDVTGGSRLPFRIRPGAPTSSIDIANTGKVGIGLASPTASLHVRRNANGDVNPLLLVEETNATVAIRNIMTLSNNGNVVFQIKNTSHTDIWSFATDSATNSFTFNANGSAPEFRLTNTGNLTLTGTLTTTGSCSVGCDAVFDDDYVIPPISARAAMMYDLGYLPNVGPTAESGEYDLTSKVLGMLNELEHAHIYIAQLNDRIEVLEARLAKAD